MTQTQRLDQTFEPELQALGFTLVRPRFWVRPRTPAVSDLFQLQAIKGASYSPRWGFSLSYVPHIAKGHLAWHRTPKSARFDFIDDPLDWTPAGTTPPVIPTLGDYPRVASAAATVAAWSLPLAQQRWAEVSGPADIVRLVPQMRGARTIRFRFDAYPCHRITMAFSLASVNRPTEAREELHHAQEFVAGSESLREQLLDALARPSECVG